ncbi:FHA domain-containing protein PS1 [Iris pallida]|uniref:FHA domain-containing protein PS1 n=1 Tax=Iris pallida TaxID=29817 RepID=A0AAX6FXT1_IRIPA|nr:FHA domain-containing protein PS1 [Iris pallida]
MIVLVLVIFVFSSLTVIRELDCLKRRESLLRFRKETKAASSVLQWIEDCMVKCSWWIHVQSSSETLPVPATPPATPRSQSGDGSEGPGNGASSPTTAFSTCGSLMEIVSPTAEDHILDCALLFKRIKDDGQLVLLSNSIALKIKGMAEVNICTMFLAFSTKSIIYKLEYEYETNLNIIFSNTVS